MADDDAADADEGPSATAWTTRLLVSQALIPVFSLISAAHM